MKFFFVFIFIVLAAGAGFFYFHNKSGAPVAQVPAQEATSTPPRTVPAGAREYRSPRYGFSLLYPDNLSVAEVPQKGGDSITLQDDASNQGFQIYVTPYAGTSISQERFLLDEPSGVRNNPTRITIDGADAMMFFGNNTAMGDTREVWFIRGGFLYEVVTYKESDAWLSAIMDSWKFL